MKTLQELFQSRAALVAEMEGILNIVKTEKRELTPEETAKYDQLEGNLDAVEDEIRTAEEKEKMEKRMARLESIKGQKIESPFTSAIHPRKSVDPNEFRSLGEMLYTLVSNPGDKRLTEIRTQQMGQGTLGGYMIPESFSSELLSVGPGEAIVRPRANVLAAGSNPDAPINIPCIDQSNGKNRWGNFQVYHSGELQSLNQSDVYLRMVKLTPHKMTGYMVTSNELLRNWQGSAGFLQAQMRSAMTAAEDVDFLRGNGVDKALGVMNCNAAKKVARGTANTIVFSDIVNMMAAMLWSNNPVWVASPTIIPQLATIRGTNNENLWVMNAAQGMPATLMGYPIIYTERVPTLGSAGDLMLLDLSKYLIKNGSGPIVDVSTQVSFASDATAFRLIWYVDGQSWLNDAIPLENTSAVSDGSVGTDTLSPFVILNTP